MSALIDITSLAGFSSHLNTLPPSTLVVLYFYTPWTAFSTGIGPGISAIASGYQSIASQSISFISINGKELTDIAKRYQVSKAPCVICLRDGKVLESIGGFDLTRIRDMLDRYASANAVVVPTVPASILQRSKDNLNARLMELTSTARVVLFMKGTPESPRCRFSRRLVGILRDHSVEFDSFDVLSDEDVRQGLKEYGDWPTYPQLWVDGKLLGGLDVVREEISTNPDFLQQSRLVLAQ